MPRSISTFERLLVDRDLFIQFLYHALHFGNRIARLVNGIRKWRCREPDTAVAAKRNVVKILACTLGSLIATNSCSLAATSTIRNGQWNVDATYDDSSGDIVFATLNDFNNNNQGFIAFTCAPAQGLLSFVISLGSPKLKSNRTNVSGRLRIVGGNTISFVGYTLDGGNSVNSLNFSIIDKALHSLQDKSQATIDVGERTASFNVSGIRPLIPKFIAICRRK